jgi:hypothetical protein
MFLMAYDISDNNYLNSLLRSCEFCTKIFIIAKPIVSQRYHVMG